MAACERRVRFESPLAFRRRKSQSVPPQPVTLHMSFYELRESDVASELASVSKHVRFSFDTVEARLEGGSSSLLFDLRNPTADAKVKKAVDDSRDGGKVCDDDDNDDDDDLVCADDAVVDEDEAWCLPGGRESCVDTDLVAFERGSNMFDPGHESVCYDRDDSDLIQQAERNSAAAPKKTKALSTPGRKNIIGRASSWLFARPLRTWRNKRPLSSKPKKKTGFENVATVEARASLQDPRSPHPDRSIFAERPNSRSTDSELPIHRSTFSEIGGGGRRRGPIIRNESAVAYNAKTTRFSGIADTRNSVG